MELQKAVKERKSIRDYEDRPVPEDKLLRILEAARMAPSAGNRQPWKFIVVRDAGRRRELAHAAGGQEHVAKAPVVIAAVATMPDRIMTCGVPSYAVDLALAVDHITLAAVDEGLGTCWIGRFSQQEAKDILGVPENYQIVTILPLGFPKEAGRPKTRKPLEEIICYETLKE
ncbi:MAG: nitroreductase family protein [Chloroflexota bacterium]